MGRKSREKGKRGEREAAEALADVLGVPFRRGQQFCGGADSPDVVPCDVDIGIHVEVKRTETLQLYQAMEQAVQDSGGSKVPLVLHRKNQRDWVGIVRLCDLVTLCERVLAVRGRTDIEMRVNEEEQEAEAGASPQV